MHDRLSGKRGFPSLAFSLERERGKARRFGRGSQTVNEQCQPAGHWTEDAGHWTRDTGHWTRDTGQSPGRRQSCCPKRFLMHSADFLQLPSLSPLSPRLSPAHSLGPFGNFVLLFCSFLLPALLHFVNIKL